jgi:prevent-host-death family protein
MPRAKQEQIGAGEFKAKCLQLIDEVNHSRIPLLITKHGKPVARLVPYIDDGHALFGCMKDTVIIKGDIVNSTGETWEADAK